MFVSSVRPKYQSTLLKIQIYIYSFLSDGMVYMIFHHLSYSIQLSESPANKFVADGQYTKDTVMIITVQLMYYNTSVCMSQFISCSLVDSLLKYCVMSWGCCLIKELYYYTNILISFVGILTWTWFICRFVIFLNMCISYYIVTIAISRDGGHDLIFLYCIDLVTVS